ncbi:MAG TPA: cytochrome c family protein [Rhizomicrobium sp.]|nr:cytochrome c family protein [Rhizomicrobium sp.]
MDSWEWNKIAGAVLGTLIFVMVVSIAGEMIYEVEPPAKPGYVVEGVVETPTAGAPAAPVVEQTPDWGTVLASADVAAGKAISQRCEQCHDLTRAAVNKIGPEMWGVVNRPKGHNPTFSYSSAMKAKGGTWTYDDLFHFIKSPSSFVPGTKMSFAGLRGAQDRINLIAFLRTEADTPPPIPAPAPAKPAEAAPAAPAAAPATPAPATPAPAAP